MSTRSFILSSAGLKNLVKQEKDYRFYFGEKEIEMNTTFAEFISPIVSHIHYSDPTIDNIHINIPPTSDIPLMKELFTDDIVNLIKHLSHGNSIEINEDQSTKIQLFSILLGNEELFKKMRELFPHEFNINEIDHIIDHLQIIDFLAKHMKFNNFDITSIIENISKNFYQISKERLNKLSRPNIYSIISNEHLTLENEDSLFDFIQYIFSNDEEDDNDEKKSGLMSKVKFLEQIDLCKLSESKFKEFLLTMKPTIFTNELWRNICNRLVGNGSESSETNRYETPRGKPILYDENEQNQFNGIIRHLMQESGGNVHEKGVVKVTESSYNGSDIKAFNLVDFDNLKTRFLSKNEENSWAQYDFGERKVRPTHYSIRSRPYSKGEYHLKGWVIEASNTGQNDWKVLDTRSGVTSLDGPSASTTFEIQEKLGKDDFYRYLRIRQTEKNADNSYYMGLSALEFFGNMI